MAKHDVKKMKAADIDGLLAKSLKAGAGAKAAAAALTKLQKGIGGISAAIGKSAEGLGKMDE